MVWFMGHVWVLWEILNPKYNLVTSEDNYLHVNSFAFQTSITIQNEIYKHAHTHTQTQKRKLNIHKTLHKNLKT